MSIVPANITLEDCRAAVSAIRAAARNRPPTATTAAAQKKTALLSSGSRPSSSSARPGSTASAAAHRNTSSSTGRGMAQRQRDEDSKELEALRRQAEQRQRAAFKRSNGSDQIVVYSTEDDDDGGGRPTMLNSQLDPEIPTGGASATTKPHQSQDREEEEGNADSINGFSLEELKAFVRQKRSSESEFSGELLCKMMAHTGKGRLLVSPEDLLTGVRGQGSSDSAFAADWLQILALAMDHGNRQRNIQSAKQSLRAPVPPPPPKGAAAPNSARSSRGRPPIDPLRPPHHTAKGNARMLSPAAMRKEAEATLALAAPASGRVPRGPDQPPKNTEFRDANGRRRLFLPVVKHPSWSRHADDEVEEEEDEDESFEERIAALAAGVQVTGRAERVRRIGDGGKHRHHRQGAANAMTLLITSSPHGDTDAYSPDARSPGRGTSPGRTRSATNIYHESPAQHASSRFLRSRSGKSKAHYDDNFDDIVKTSRGVSLSQQRQLCEEMQKEETKRIHPKDGVITCGLGVVSKRERSLKRHIEKVRMNASMMSGDASHFSMSCASRGAPPGGGSSSITGPCGAMVVDMSTRIGKPFHLLMSQRAPSIALIPGVGENVHTAEDLPRRPGVRELDTKEAARIQKALDESIAKVVRYLEVAS